MLCLAEDNRYFHFISFCEIMSITYRGMHLTGTASVTRKAANAPEICDIFDGLTKTNIKTSHHFKDPNQPKCGKFIEDANKRQESRRNQIHGLINKMETLKLCTGDDLMVVIFNADRENYHVVAADLKMNHNPVEPANVTTSLSSPAVSSASVSTPQTVTTPSGSSTMVDFEHLGTLRANLAEHMQSPPVSSPLPSIPGYKDLLSSSPTKLFPKKMTAHIFSHQQRNACRICGIESGSDKTWMGCQYADRCKTQNDGCSYWVHIHCKGFAESDADEFTDIPFYCPTMPNTKVNGVMVNDGDVGV